MTIDLSRWGGAGNATLNDISGNNISDILNQIQNLQATETKLISALDAYTSASGYVSSDPALIEMVNNINNIADARIAMFQTISQNANMLQTGVSQSRTDLVAQMTLLNAVEDQLNQAKGKIDELQSTNDTKMRMVEINTYYGQRYEAQSNVMKQIIMICIPVLILFILKKKSLIPETIANYIIGITIAIGAFILMFKLWDISTRNNMHFDSYDWKYESPAAQTPSIWQYNKENMFNFNKMFQDLMTNLGICVSDKCCAKGTIYSTKKQQCVMPSAAIQGFTTYENSSNYSTTSENMSTSTSLKGTLLTGGVLPYSPDVAFASL
jgi:hypothetical protein